MSAKNDQQYFEMEAVGRPKFRPELEARVGYDPLFLGKNFSVPLPSVNATKDVLAFADSAGNRQTVLNYTHFSLQMSKSRRLCFFSACNIDGSSTADKAPARAGWKFDPRIAEDRQIGEEVYGRKTKTSYWFARGHMTRRVDAIWGAKAQRRLGNSDSMFVPNACPQDQSFNGGLWKTLEDRILAAAVADGDRVSVFTGPIFNHKDPVFQGVAIPLWYWKVVAWKNKRSLKAVGYLQSQKKLMEANGFVPSVVGLTGAEGQAVRLETLGKTAGIDFGPLLQADILKQSRSNVIDVSSAKYFMTSIVLA